MPVPFFWNGLLSFFIYQLARPGYRMAMQAPTPLMATAIDSTGTRVAMLFNMVGIPANRMAFVNRKTERKKKSRKRRQQVAEGRQ